MKNISGAEAVIHCLLEEGVDILFGYPGGAIMPVYDELYKFENKINHILVRHEQGATHAAQGYARSSGKVGVAIATSGPGATNLVTGIADAQIDSTPMVCITGQVASSLLGSDAFQETDIIGISTPVTKWNYQITKASEISEIFAKAFYIAKSGRPGPVLLDIPDDLQRAYVDTSHLPRYSARDLTCSDGLYEQVKELLVQLSLAKRPVIVLGGGLSTPRTVTELREFLKHVEIPLLQTWAGLDLVPFDQKYRVGTFGVYGSRLGNFVIQNADLVVCLGYTSLAKSHWRRPKLLCSECKNFHG